jgi:hypothetical protein
VRSSPPSGMACDGRGGSSIPSVRRGWLFPGPPFVRHLLRQSQLCAHMPSARAPSRWPALRGHGGATGPPHHWLLPDGRLAGDAVTQQASPSAGSSPFLYARCGSSDGEGLMMTSGSQWSVFIKRIWGLRFRGFYWSKCKIEG